METIKEAKEYLRANYVKGTTCPCCNQFVKLYKRKINAGMARALLLIYRISLENPQGWIHVQDEFLKRWKINAIRLEYNKLEHWGLIEKMPGDNASGAARSGYWKMTDQGIRFTQRSIKIREKVLLYDAKVQGFTGKTLDIVEALQNKFDYAELIKG